MKKLLLSVFALSAFYTANAQCTELFISEYVEGTSNNKAIEIYNPSTTAIAMSSNYRLVRYNNGTGAAAAEANVQAWANLGNHVMQPGEAWVIVLDKRDSAAACPGQDCAVDLSLQAVADTFMCPDYNVNFAMYFNGNDALSLQKFNGSTWNNVDIFGMIGDPAMVSGVAWSDQFPYDGSAGTWWTINKTLFRKPTVDKGVTVNPSPEFIVTTEWDSLPQNTYTGLGTHVCNCPAASINDIDNSISVTAFPNPVNTGLLNITTAEIIISAEITNTLGQVVLTNSGSRSKSMSLTTEQLPKGVYFLKVLFDNKKQTVVKVSIQ